MSNTQTPDQTTVCNLLAQRNRFLSLLTPPARYTPVSPYPQYTKQQLDMRRKVEILQYKKNTTQVSRPTKSQKWSQIANAPTNRYVACNKNPYASSPTTACDVPGPVINLTYDPSIPLYNYATNQDAYANFNKEVVIPWEYHIESDVSGGYMSQSYENINEPQESQEETEIIEYEATDDKLIGTLVVQNTKEQETTFKLTVPIGLFVYGTTVLDLSNNVLGTIQITKAVLNVYYYSGDIETNPVVSVPITNSLTNTNILDLSMSFVPTISNATFNGSQYIGDIIIPEIKLSTYYGFLYDFKLYFELSYTPAYNSSVVGYPTFGVYINIPPYDISSNGCIITPQNPNIFFRYSPYVFTQV
jgi:hypothetical protein